MLSSTQMLVNCEFISFLRGIRVYNFNYRNFLTVMTWIKRKLIIVVEEDCFLRLLCRFDITRELSSRDDGRLEGGCMGEPPSHRIRSRAPRLGHRTVARRSPNSPDLRTHGTLSRRESARCCPECRGWRSPGEDVLWVPSPVLCVCQWLSW